MEDLQYILKEISELTSVIETKYPELYRNLDENPVTLPESKYPHINKQVLQEYLESLKELLKHHT